MIGHGLGWIRYRGAGIGVAMLAVFAGGLPAQEMVVSVETQVSLFTRILAFDRNLTERVGHEIVIGVAYEPQLQASVDARDALLRLLPNGVKIEGIRLRAVAIATDNVNELRTGIQQNAIDIIYVAPLQTLSLDAITSICRDLGVVTYTGIPEYVSAGVAVGIAMSQRRLEILINLPAAIAVGAEFSSELLKLARLVDQQP